MNSASGGLQPPTVVVLALLTVVSIGCQAATLSAPSEPTSASPSEIAVKLHLKLGRAAKDNDLTAFKRILTAQSVRLLDRYFDATRVADELKQPALGWPEFLEEHAALSDEELRRAPYPVDDSGPEPRLALSKHHHADFFQQFIQTAQKAALTSSPSSKKAADDRR